MSESVWVCGACGKMAPERENVGDVSCYVNSVEVDKDSLIFDSGGRVVTARAINVTVTDHE